MYALRWRRRRLLWRAFRRRRELVALQDRTGQIGPGAILVFCTVRNEAARLPFFLDHYRRLGVDHFLFVDNASTDGTTEFLASQPHTSVWRTEASYRRARYGVDWLTWLMIRHGHGHWCLTLDADEILVYPYWETRDLVALTGRLEAEGRSSFGALMLDMYPDGPLDAQDYAPGTDPVRALPWFDAGNYSIRLQARLGALWIQGGPRARAFFADEPRRAPTLNKTPLVRWNRRFAYVNSTHSLLPPRLNRVFDTRGGELLSGVLLHTKFLPGAPGRAAEEKARGEHFGDPAAFGRYYDAIGANPTLRCRHSRRLTGWRQLEALGLMSRGGWI